MRDQCLHVQRPQGMGQAQWIKTKHVTPAASLTHKGGLGSKGVLPPPTCSPTFCALLSPTHI